MSEQEQSDQENEENNKGSPKFNFYWIYAIIGVILISLNLFTWNAGSKEITRSEFEQMVRNGDVEKINIYNEEEAEVFIKPEKLDQGEHAEKIEKPMLSNKKKGPHYSFNIGPAESFQERLDKLKAEKEFRVSYKQRSNWGKELLQWVIFIGIMIAIWAFVMKRLGGGSGAGSQLFNIGKSKAKVFEKGKKTQVTFNDIAGLDGAKEEIWEIVDFLSNPNKYTELGAKIPKGALLVGAPGTGKTMLAKAVAGEADVPFFSISGSDFVEMFVGVGASRVRDLFKQAKEKAPAIIFIDEIDTIGRARGKNPSMGGNDERENTLNQLLSEMDGFDTNSGVIIMAASNRAEVLDKALLRAGRFDRQIGVDLPDLNERKKVFEVHLRPIKADASVDVDVLAKQTPGFSGADIANICNEAALYAARKNKKWTEHQDLMDAIDRVIAGMEKRGKIIAPNEKKTIAYHEAGHATVSWLVEHASPLVKVSVIPRGQSLGAAWYLPEERQLTTKEQIHDEICAALGGRAAEEVIFNKVSTGALNDLEKVTKQAYAMVSYYGLSEKLGNLSYYDSTGQQEYAFTKPYSDDTAKIIDEEAKAIVDSNYQRAISILQDNKEKLIALAEKLQEKEVIFRGDLESIFGKKAGETEGQEEASPDNEESHGATDKEEGSSDVSGIPGENVHSEEKAPTEQEELYNRNNFADPDAASNPGDQNKHNEFLDQSGKERGKGGTNKAKGSDREH